MPNAERVKVFSTDNLTNDKKRHPRDKHLVMDRILDRQILEQLSVAELSLRFRKDMKFFVEESVLKLEKEAHFSYQIDHADKTIRMPGYAESVDQLKENNEELFTQMYGEIPSRPKADGETWQQLVDWALTAPTNSALLWSSPADVLEQGYWGEQSFSYFWLYVKTSDNELQVTQYRGWPNVTQISQIHDRFGQPVPAGDERLHERIVKNIIKIDPQKLAPGQDYAAYVDSIIYQAQDEWILQPQNLDVEGLERFWQEEQALFEALFLPNALYVLQNLPTFSPFIEHYRKSNEYHQKAEQLATLFELFHSGLVKWLEEFRKHGQNVYSFVDSESNPNEFIQAALHEMARFQLEKKEGKVLNEKQRRRELEIFNALFSVSDRSLSLAHCVALSPFSIVNQAIAVPTLTGGLSIDLLNHLNLVAFHGYYIPREPGWKYTKDVICQNCNGEKGCAVIGPCDICAACDPRAHAISGKNHPPLSLPTHHQTAPTPLESVVPTTAQPEKPKSDFVISPFDLINGNLEVIRQIAA